MRQLRGHPPNLESIKSITIYNSDGQNNQKHKEKRERGLETLIVIRT